MPPEGDMNSLGERSPSPERTDTEHAEIEEEISEREMDLLALEEVLALAQRDPAATEKEIDDMGMELLGLDGVVALAQSEAAAIRQRLGDVEESGNDLAAAEPGLLLAEILAKIDRNLIDRGLSYLKKALRTRRFVGPTSSGGVLRRNGGFYDPSQVVDRLRNGA
ncbi:unnamed protein product [Fusarium equiseti]|uniref:Uncharacterized protein n=1 Tax=Fusarium equiseti TaxID=61235 RepID=A0A8J2N5V2_FUSEQ|nr:unnamed protein product [Fusarium equiseti]